MKEINYLISVSVMTIILALSSFYILTSTTSFLAYAQNIKNSTETSILFKTADILFNQKKYDEAIPYYDKILTRNASEIDALNHKGISLWALHKYKEALPYFDQILSINSSNVKALNNKDLLYWDCKKMMRQ